MLAQLVTSMAHHEYLSLEGGHLLIEFIVRQCALTSGSDEASKTRTVNLSIIDSLFSQSLPLKEKLSAICS